MSNSTVIGTTSSFYGVATFQSQPIITSTILANNDNTTNIATTAWANSFLTYKQTQPNSWTGAQTFTTANVSVLNVFKTSVDTINASSITSDMTIGANLNGGSLTIGAVNSVTNITSGTINASYFKMYSSVIDGKQGAWLDTIQSNLTPNIIIGFNNASQVFVGSKNTPLVAIGGDAGTVKIASDGLSAGARVSIATGTNATNTEMTLGSTTLSYNNIRGNIIHIADTGLSATGKVHIASGVNGGNATGSEIYMGSTTLSTLYLRGKDVLINYQQGTPQAPVYTYIGNDTAGITNIAGAVNIGTSNANTGSTTIGNNSAPGNITINKPLTVGYLPTFTSSSQIGWNNLQDSGIVPTVYYGGNRTWLWWGESGVSPLYPGIYMVCYTSYTNRTTNYTQSFVYKTLTKPTYALDVTGITPVNESNFEFPSGYTGGFKMCGSGIAYIPSYNYYIGIIQNVFATGSPNGNIYCAANIIRIA